jgi:triosephosphate isomerase (TIM)
MTRAPLLAGNWKMNGALPEAVALARALRARIGAVEGREVLVAPPFPALAAVAAELRDSGFLLAGQNLYWEDAGAFTGEVSGPMLAAAGCSHVIVGHSERRQLFGERDETVARKVEAALRCQLTPIVCVGETLDERESDATLTVVERQVRGALGALDTARLGAVILAYEPVWAIGTGRVASPTQAQEVHSSMRSLVADLGGGTVADNCRILYGGSVKPDNVDELMAQPDIDGALVGGASLVADDFARIVAFRS